MDFLCIVWAKRESGDMKLCGCQAGRLSLSFIRMKIAIKLRVLVPLKKERKRNRPNTIPPTIATEGAIHRPLSVRIALCISAISLPNEVSILISASSLARFSRWKSFAATVSTQVLTHNRSIWNTRGEMQGTNCRQQSSLACEETLSEVMPRARSVQTNLF